MGFINSSLKFLACFQILLSTIMAYSGMKNDALLASVDAIFFWMMSND